MDEKNILWLLKPLQVIVNCLRTKYSLEDYSIKIKPPFRRSYSIRIDEFDEIGVETTDQGPFVEDVFLVLKRGKTRIRIPDPHPLFRDLMDSLNSLEGFDWEPFTKAMSCTENRYFLCWRRTKEPF